jgi:phosphoserine phosphatase
MAGFTYKSYSFVDKDPIIDEVRGVFDAAGVSKQWVEDESGVTTHTLRQWFDGKTRRPQAATVNAVLRSLGYKLGVVSMGAAAKPVIVTAPASARHVVQMAKFKKGK